MSTDCGACVWSGADYDGPDGGFYVGSHPRARKPHACYECHRTIAPGERYCRVASKWDGRIYVMATCLECEDIGNSLSCDGTWIHGGLWEAIDEIAEQIGFACIEKLTLAAAKVKLQAYVNKQRGL